MITAITGEIGNNSFDHNLGNWPNTIGVFFDYRLVKNNIEIILADKGQGIFNTLKKVKPKLKNDKEALEIAFTKKISGRAPENRGNGLKFVKENVINDSTMYLELISGNTKIMLNNYMKFELVKKTIKGCLCFFKIKNL